MKHLQALAYQWAVRCFGIDHVQNKEVRVLRLIEEVAECAQAIDVSREQLNAVLDIVYSRPKGSFQKELGGVAMTFAVLCESQGHTIDQVLCYELNKVLSGAPEYYAARNALKVQPSNG